MSNHVPDAWIERNELDPDDPYCTYHRERDDEYEEPEEESEESK